MLAENKKFVEGIGYIPTDWDVRSANEVSLKITKGTTPPKAEIVEKSDIPFLRVNNLGFNGLIDKKSDFIFVSRSAHDRFLARSKAYPGDILMNIVGPPLGKISLLDDEFSEYNMNQAVVIYRLVNDIIHGDYFLAYLMSNVAQQWLQSRSKKTSGQQNLTIELCKGLPVPIPSFIEQRKIAAILSTWDKAITTTEHLLANSQQQKKALMQQLLTGKKRLLDENGVRFSGEWKFVLFSDVFKVANQKSAQVKSSDYLSFGDVPIVDQGQKLIAGYCNNAEHYKDIPVIIFGDHTRCIKWVDFAFCPGADGTQVLVSRSMLDIKFGYFLLSHADIPNLGYSRHMRVLKELEFKVPSDLKEQRAIAAVLTLAENEIKKYEQKLEALKQEKKALMQQLLTGKRRVKVDEEAA